MRLELKKQLAARALQVGKGRILFNTTRLTEIKEAITKQDIKDLQADKAITIKEIKGSQKKKKKTTRRRAGSIKLKVNTRKQDYVKQTRKLRKHLLFLKKTKQISQENFEDFRKQVRARNFKSLAQMKDAHVSIGTEKATTKRK